MNPSTQVPAVSPKVSRGTRSSVVVERCQVCGSGDLSPVLFLGYLPPVNQMPRIGERPHEQPAYPAELLYCNQCRLAQLGLIVDPEILFPPEYPYSSGTTALLRRNFTELYQEASSLLVLRPDDLVVDIGSNDGTLLSNFQAGGHRVLGIEPTLQREIAQQRGIPSVGAFFDSPTARQVRTEHGPARVITAANVFAHIEDIHSIVEGILLLLADDGVFISESHYFASLVETLQYDTIYHEHLRYYSVRSLSHLLAMHGLEVWHARRIPTHGGSVRVYASRQGQQPVRESVAALTAWEDQVIGDMASLQQFRRRVVESKIALHALLQQVRSRGERIFAVGAPSRASTLVNYTGLDDGMIECVVEIAGSQKIGKNMPGTLIPVVDEKVLYEEQPEYALLLSWHIADELMPKITARGFRGQYIVPLPQLVVVGEKVRGARGAR